MLEEAQTDTIIYSGKESLIIRDQKNTEQSLCLKILKTQFPSHHQLKEFENEFQFSSSTDCTHIRKAIKKTTVDNCPAIVFDYIKSDSLLEHTANSSLSEKIDLAINIIKAITEIHKEGIIHRNLNPGNLLIENDTNKVFVIDFSLATKIAAKAESGTTNNGILLSYISPEQTGRINRTIDNRSDIYSLGVILYELFAEKLPFNSLDPLELIYAHLAKSAQPLNDIKVEIPIVISQIIIKCISKNAEDRYQSAAGILYDFEKCKETLESTNTIKIFPIAENDFSGKFSIRERLYGREIEIKTLVKIFEKSNSGLSQFLLVSGASGKGKSALCKELQKPIARKEGNYLLGKFEQFQHDIPYAAFTQAFSEFIEIILKQEEAIQASWKAKILHSVGYYGKVLIDIIPGLESLIGIQPEVQELNGLEVQNRFTYILTNFIKTIATKAHPLVIYLDDLQWADESSLNLLKMMVNEIENSHLLIIGAYRNNEIEKEHTLNQIITSQKFKIESFTEIELHNLTIENVNSLVKDVLHSNQNNTNELAESIFNKTKGNAFYVNQFLKTINEAGILFFDFEKKEWVWDKNHVLQMNVSGNVVDLLKLNICKLPPDSIDFLKIAACIGNKFEIEDVTIYLKKDVKLTEQLIQKPLQDGMIIQTVTGYKFSHDRIQEAIYQLIPEEEKKRIHLNIGKSISDNFTEHDLHDQIFEIVKQWNLGKDLITDQETKNYLSQLNQIAGHKSRTSAAYTQAFYYFEISISLLEKDHWEVNYESSLKTYNEASEVAYLCSNYENVDELSAITIKNSKNLNDSIKSYETSILKLIAQNKLMEAIDLGLIVLKMLGHNFPSNPKQFNILLGLLKTKISLRNKSEEYFNSLPEMTNARDLASIRIMYEILSAAYFGMANLVPLLIFKMVQISVKSGLSRISPFSFMGYGYIECLFMNKVDSGISFGNIALNMLDRFKIDELRASSLMTYNVFLLHWKKPISETIPALENGFLVGLENGDYEYSSYLAHNITYHSFLAGVSLKDLAGKSEKLDKQIEKFRQDLTIKRLRIYRESFNNLIHTKNEPDVLEGLIFNEEDITLPDIIQNHGYFQNLYLQKMMLAIIFNKNENAIEHAITGRKYLESVKGSALYSTFFFYESLALSKACIIYPEKKELYLKNLTKNLIQIQKFEGLCFENFGHKAHLVEAEILHLKGNSEKARTLFDRAIRNAAKSRMVQDEALCWERAGLFYFEIKERFIARFYLQHALTAYHRWGAEAKVKQMQALYGDILIEKSNREQANDIDLLTVIKASTAISGEIILPKLLKNLMTILLKNAGAQRGFLILERNGELYIEAESSDESDEVEIQSTPLLNCGKLSEDVVNHVVFTLESLIIEDATDNMRFNKDPFIQANQSKSILCYPFINQGKLRGIIYLSNDLTNGAFTESRLSLLKMLTGQIAVSIENASLYENLEKNVEERTHKIIDQKKEIEQKNKDITHSIMYAKRLQNAILPPLGQIQENLPENFILYKPKDIIAGDFYWAELIDNYYYLAVADCTGHGVPGAMVSIVCSNALNRTINEFGIRETGKILDNVRDLVVEVFSKSGEEITDGMDISLCRINKLTQEIQWSGANNPIWYVQNEELIEIKGDKQPIGIYSFCKPFQSHTFNLEKGTNVYIFSDGYADQFGGPKGKKFRYKHLKEDFSKMSQLSMQDQLFILNNTFEDWKGENEQVDDVTIIGFRL